MKAGRGGARCPTANFPSASCNSRREVSARVDKRSWLFLGVRSGRRRVCADRADELDAREDSEVEEELRLSRDRSDEDEFERGAAVGITTPLCFIRERENVGALPAKSGPSATTEAGDGAGTVSAHRPLLRAGCRTGEEGGERVFPALRETSG